MLLLYWFDFAPSLEYPHPRRHDILPRIFLFSAWDSLERFHGKTHGFPAPARLAFQLNTRRTWPRDIFVFR